MPDVLLSLQDALSTVDAVAGAHRLPVERLELADALGSVIAEPVTGRLSMPPFRNSARDGFVVASDVVEGLWYHVSGESRAGDSEEAASALAPPVARVMTGAPLPSWAHAIVMIEDTERTESQVRVTAAISPGAWIREAGSDLAAGDILLTPGRRVIGEHVQALASAGVASVMVHRRPRVGLCSTGDELVPLGEQPLQSGQIFDSNRPSLTAQIEAFGADVPVSEHVGDSLEAMLDFLHRAMAEHLDLIVSSGAVSMGNYDFVRPALEAVGADIRFHRVAQKPGKPLLFAVLPNGTLYFGLPGNPVSSTVNCRFYVSRALAAMQGMASEQPLMLPLVESIDTPRGMSMFLKARLETGSEPRVRALEGQESFQTSPLLSMNGWILVDQATESPKAGERVCFYPMHPEALPAVS